MNAGRTTWTKVTRFRGDTARIPFRLTDELGAVYDPTDKVLIFSVKAAATDPDSAALVQKQSTIGGFYIVDAAAGLVQVELVPADYDKLSVGSEYSCDVQGQDLATGAVKTVGRIVLVIAQDVTQGTAIAIPTTTTNPGTPIAWDNIGGVPATFPPEPHADSHATGGTDPLTPAAIGAETPAGAQAKADAAQSAAEQTAAAALTAHRLEDLANVVIASPQHGDRIAYNAGADRWENSNVTDGGFF